MMRMISCYNVILVLIVHLQNSVQQDGVQPCNNEIVKAIINIENRLEEKLSSFFEDKMSDLLENKMSDLLDDKMPVILGEKMTEHEGKMSILLDSKISNFENKMIDFEDRMSDLIDTKMSNFLSKFQGTKNISGDTSVGNINTSGGNINTNGGNINTSGGNNDTVEVTTITEEITSTPVIYNTSGGCPVSEGFFVIPGVYQCFKTFRDQQWNWTLADVKCKSHGLELAKPNDAVAVRKYIVENIGEDGYSTWIGGRGIGDTFRWIRDQEVLPSNSHLWRPAHPHTHVNSDDCLLLLTANDWLSLYYSMPYASEKCSRWNYPLCELILESSSLAGPIDSYDEEYSYMYTLY